MYEFAKQVKKDLEMSRTKIVLLRRIRELENSISRIEREQEARDLEQQAIGVQKAYTVSNVFKKKGVFDTLSELKKSLQDKAKELAG